ncbi:phospholipase D family protein [Halomonas chromatireducens]|uniref:Cardiolipin synthase n=1 Tax=Halomonas chromatireducens TaxID=507626 RepID=A0A0X8HAW7_9GAMM|nr:phospholipase D family protein [Halomonas chromatireducens]AMC99261.1 Cardiolipin synthase [Halomonas chromatireducens]
MTIPEGRAGAWARRLPVCLVFALVWLLAGCAGSSVPREHGAAMTPDDIETTWLGQWAAQSAAPHDGQSGFALVSSGQDAFSLRVLLSEQADQRLDIQTYLMGDGLTTRVLLARLLDAAERGVKVRLLLDDIGAVGQGRRLAALDSHPNVQVRVYNPLALGRGYLTTRVLASIPRAGRQHRRMHNKLWLADGAVALVGGRNLGDEYYSASEPRNFSDLDMMVIGPVVEPLARSYSLYWNHGLAQPIGRYHRAEEGAWRELQASLGEWVGDNGDDAYFTGLRERYADTRQGPLVGRLHWGDGVALWDPPGKPAWPGRPAFQRTMAGELLAEVGEPSERLVVISAYFVPGRAGTQYLRSLADAGVEVAVFTNSLEATDVPVVHGAYQARRDSLLQSGIRLHELRAEREPGSEGEISVGGSASALHIKALGIDNDRVFVGSANADPRSVWWNTEVGVLAYSESLAAELQALADLGKSPVLSYRVDRGDDGQRYWQTEIGGESVWLISEPGGFWRHLGALISRLLPVDAWL